SRATLDIVLRIETLGRPRLGSRPFVPKRRSTVERRELIPIQFCSDRRSTATKPSLGKQWRYDAKKRDAAKSQDGGDITEQDHLGERDQAGAPEERIAPDP